ncbi:MAG: hypothetical protein KDA25_11320, partial [Phycisphaerales bacterium]|nr:hypothetical protein [Phycisphaerales bacterium]
MEPSAQDNRFAIIARALALAVLGLATVAPLGCDTMGDDFRSIGRTLVPPKPGEAARWMFED